MVEGAGSPTRRPTVYVAITLTRSKVKVKVTDHLNVRQLPITARFYAWSSKLTVDVDSMGPGLQPVGARFSNFFLEKVSLQFILHGMSIFHDIQMATYFGTA